MNSKDFGKRVADLRKGKGLTQSELAEKLNISNKAISRWETGEGYPEITILPSLAKELGVSIDELLSESSEDSDFENQSSEADCETVNAFQRRQREDIPLKKPYWKSMTIFNKIGFVSIIINITALLLYLLMVITGFIFNGLPTLFFLPVIIYGIAAVISKVGLVSTIIGLIAGLLNLYDRQIKVSITMVVILFVASYILPLIMVTMSSGIVF